MESLHQKTVFGNGFPRSLRSLGMTWTFLAHFLDETVSDRQEKMSIAFPRIFAILLSKVLESTIGEDRGAVKILILSCFTGEGHNSAAYALMEAFQRAGAACQMADPVGFDSERVRKFVSNVYNNMIKKRPEAFGVLYQAGSLYSATGITSPVYLGNARYAPRLHQYIQENGFDAVVSTHLYGMEAMTAIRNRLDSAVSSYGVMTDYTCIPFFQETVLDGYFVPCAGVKDQLVKGGIPETAVHVTGIPVSARFRERLSKDEARSRLEIPCDKKIYLIMTGGVGCENMRGLCQALLQSQRDDFIAYVLVGRNEELKQTLDAQSGGDGRIQTVGFTKDVNLYMNAADVMISKAGGLSSTEAAVANVPLVHFRAIPGCETQNAIFFETNGMSVRAGTEQEAIARAEELANNRELAERMRAMQRQTIHPDAAEDIVRWVMRHE